jgi:hypothetical protein
MGRHGFVEVTQDLAALETQGLDCCENPLDKPASTLAVIAEADLPPNYGKP